MKIREIHIYPDLTVYPAAVTRPFRDRSRSLCNYLERSLRKSSFESAGFSRVCIVGASNPEAVANVNSAGALVIEVPFSSAEFELAPDTQWNELLIGMLTSGLSVGAHLLPVSELTAAIASFRGAGYINEWIHKRRALRTRGLEAELHCDLTQTSFLLRLRVFKDKRLVFDQKIRQTIPDETIFQRELNDVKFSENEIRVIDKAGGVLYRQPLSAFL
jgi:hypothetical protein